MPRLTYLLCASIVSIAGCGDDHDAVFASAGSGASGGSIAAGGSAMTGGGSTGGAPGSGGGASANGGAGGGSGGGAPVACLGKTGRPGDAELTLRHGGADRAFRVHTPPSYDGTTPLPVVLVFHGYTETSAQIETITQMTPAADARSYIAVYPQGVSTSWNAGSCCGSAATLGVDDVGFVGAMLDEIEAAYCVDERRIYSAGFSNGGMLSHRLACEMSNRIAAIGPVAGTMAIASCTPSRPVPVMHFHGTSDFVVWYDGGGFSGAQSAPDTIAGWVDRNGCTASPVPTFSMGDAHCEAHRGCDEGATVTLCTLEGGGHQWPGGESAGPGGQINMDLSASEAMLDFFDAHPMP